MTNHKDTDLREALRRRYADTPQLSADFTDRLMQRIEEPRPRKERRIKSLPYWGRLVGAAAASVLLLLTIHYYHAEPEKETVIAQKAEQQPPLTEKLTEPQPPLMAEQTTKPETKPTAAEEKPRTEKTAQKATILAQKVKEKHRVGEKQAADTGKQSATEEETTLKNLLAANFSAMPTPKNPSQLLSEDEKKTQTGTVSKLHLYAAEIEQEAATHKRQAAYEQEMKQRCLQLLLTLLTPQEEEREATAGKVRTQQS